MILIERLIEYMSMMAANPVSVVGGLGATIVGGSLSRLAWIILRGKSEDDTDKFVEMKLTFNSIFKATNTKSNLGYSPILISMNENSLGVSYGFKLPTGMTVEALERAKSNIENELKYRVTFTSNYDRVYIQTVEHPLESLYELKDNMHKIPKNRKQASFVIGVVKDGNGEQFPVLNLTSEFCHLLVAGVSGSGKSGFIKSMFTQLCYKDIEIWILDMKNGVETSMLQDFKNVKKYEYRMHKTPQFISMVNNEMNRRYDTMTSARCKDYKDYNKKHPKTRIEPLVVMIEEISDLERLYLGASQELRSVMMKARASNINIIATIQRPDAKMLDSGTKSQFQNRVSFRQVSRINSEIALGNYLAVDVLKDEPIGRGFIQTENLVDVMFQSYYIEDEDLLQILKNKIREVKEVKEVIKMPVKLNTVSVGSLISGKPIDIANRMQAIVDNKNTTTKKSNIEDNLILINS